MWLTPGCKVSVNLVWYDITWFKSHSQNTFLLRHLSSPFCSIQAPSAWHSYCFPLWSVCISPHRFIWLFMWYMACHCCCHWCLLYSVRGPYPVAFPAFRFFQSAHGQSGRTTLQAQSLERQRSSKPSIKCDYYRVNSVDSSCPWIWMTVLIRMWSEVKIAPNVHIIFKY